MKKNFCDKCRLDITDTDSKYAILNIEIKSELTSGTKFDVELCSICISEFREWLTK